MLDAGLDIGIDADYVLLIVAMGLVTYIPRWFPLFFLSQRKLPSWFVEWLDLIPVAILGSGTFDAFQATDLSTITFGHRGGEDSMAFCSPWDWDVNSDGYADLLCFFRTSATRFQCGDTQATLKGMTQDGTALTGKGPVRIIPCRAASR